METLPTDITSDIRSSLRQEAIDHNIHVDTSESLPKDELKRLQEQHTDLDRRLAALLRPLSQQPVILSDAANNIDRSLSNDPKRFSKHQHISFNVDETNHTGMVTDQINQRIREARARFERALKEAQVSLENASRLHPKTNTNATTLRTRVAQYVRDGNSTGIQQIKATADAFRREIEYLLQSEVQQRIYKLESQSIIDTGEQISQVALDIMSKASEWLKEWQTKLKSTEQRVRTEFRRELVHQMEESLLEVAQSIENTYTETRSQYVSELQHDYKTKQNELIQRLDEREQSRRKHLREQHEQQMQHDFALYEKEQSRRHQLDREQYERSLRDEHESKLADMKEALDKEYRNAKITLEDQLQQHHEQQLQKRAQEALVQFEADLSKREQELRRKYSKQRDVEVARIKAEEEGKRIEKYRELDETLRTEMMHALDETQEQLDTEEHEYLENLQQTIASEQQKQIMQLQSQHTQELQATIASLRASLEEEHASRIEQIMDSHRLNTQRECEDARNKLLEEWEQRKNRLEHSLEQEKQRKIVEYIENYKKELHLELMGVEQQLQTEINEDLGTLKQVWTRNILHAKKDLKESVQSIDKNHPIEDRSNSPPRPRQRMRGLRHADILSPDTKNLDESDDEENNSPWILNNISSFNKSQLEKLLEQMDRRQADLLQRCKRAEQKVAKFARQVIEMKTMLKQTNSETFLNDSIINTTDSKLLSSTFLDQTNKSTISNVDKTDPWYQMCQRLYKANESLMERLNQTQQEQSFYHTSQNDVSTKFIGHSSSISLPFASKTTKNTFTYAQIPSQIPLSSSTSSSMYAQNPLLSSTYAQKPPASSSTYVQKPQSSSSTYPQRSSNQMIGTQSSSMYATSMPLTTVSSQDMNTSMDTSMHENSTSDVKAYIARVLNESATHNVSQNIQKYPDKTDTTTTIATSEKMAHPVNMKEHRANTRKYSETTDDDTLSLPTYSSVGGSSEQYNRLRPQRLPRTRGLQELERSWNHQDISRRQESVSYSPSSRIDGQGPGYIHGAPLLNTSVDTTDSYLRNVRNKLSTIAGMTIQPRKTDKSNQPADWYPFQPDQTKKVNFSKQHSDSEKSNKASSSLETKKPSERRKSMTRSRRLKLATNTSSIHKNRSMSAESTSRNTERKTKSNTHWSPTSRSPSFSMAEKKHVHHKYWSSQK